jgi:hypothetical protein
MHVCMDAWLQGCMDTWMQGCKDVLMQGFIDAEMHGCMCMYRCMDACIRGAWKHSGICRLL